MVTFVSMLRGVNVGGHNRVKMPELAELFQSLGFAGVRTYVQSGNIVFSSSAKDTASVEKKIEKALKQRLSLGVNVLVRTRDELRNIVVRNPFTGKNPDRLHVTFLAKKPVSVPIEKLNTLRTGEEEFAVRGRQVYLFLPNGIGRSKLSNNFLEKALAMPATTRNWNTVTALLEMASETIQ